MNIQIPFSLVPSILFVVLCIVPTSTILWLFKKQTERKKSPLNMDMLRSPGESLNEQIQEVSGDILMYLLMIPTGSVFIYSIFITDYFLSKNKVNIIIYLAICVVGFIYLTKRVLTLMKYRNHLRLGYDCELAVGQELTNRMKDGFHVYHDFPAEEFNIDHILVGPTGVFAIETKGRAKNRVVEKKNWKVEYDGKKLRFPGWAESKPIEQAKAQAVWLSSWLSRVTGAPCNVTPVLAIPGWWIERTAPGNIAVYNGKNSDFLAKGKTLMTPQQIKAISYQIEQKCRTVESTSYKQKR